VTEAVDSTYSSLAASLAPAMESMNTGLLASLAPAMESMNTGLLASLAPAMKSASLQVAQFAIAVGPMIEAAQNAHTSQARTIGTPTPQQVAILGFILVWLWWLAQKLSDLDREGVTVADLDVTQLLDFIRSTLEVPALLFGMPSLLGMWLKHRKSR
jgi:hypothetical protein